MNHPRILHLVDDTTAGGVTRMLDLIRTHPGLAAFGSHDVRQVSRRTLSFGRFEADLIVSHLALAWRVVPALVSLRALHPNVPLIHVEHSYTEAFVDQNVARTSRFHALLRTGYSMFDRIVAVSAAQGAWIQAQRFTAKSALRVIPPCVDLSGFRALARHPGPLGAVGALGRLDRQKGFDHLIEAFRSAPGARLSLHVFGTGPQEATLKAQAKGDSRIKFHGFTDPEVAMGLVNTIVMPSRWEAYGLVALEARSAGRNLLVSDVDGLRDHGAQGATLCKGRDPQAWGNAIAQLAHSRAHPALNGNEEEAFAAAWRDLCLDLLPVPDHDLQQVMA